QVTEARRNDLARQIRHQAEAWSIGTSSVEEIDEFNILGATKLAMVRAVQALGLTADYLLIDGNQGIKMKVRQQTVVDGDCLSASIAAASILAKVYRDELMNRLHKDYPCYNFAANKGYLTKEHASALKRFGACPIHRKSFAPIKAV
ncbi:MAG TPA: ribonuclease HII, partial [Desulfobacteria bacterium]|nr:ribonuclease HII [Desulfobacteria bacterium]